MYTNFPRVDKDIAGNLDNRSTLSHSAPMLEDELEGTIVSTSTTLKGPTNDLIISIGDYLGLKRLG